MNVSFWERSSWLEKMDYAIVGSGIVGLTCALRLRERFPRARILILERGLLPNGASTKNAGFACFGSISEILDDLKTHSEEEVLELIKQRVKGLSHLRRLIGDEHLDYQELGGYELFTKKDAVLYEQCVKNIPKINALLHPIFNQDAYSIKKDRFGFKNIQSDVIFNQFEGQIDTGKMMEALLYKVHSQNIKILNNTAVQHYVAHSSGVSIHGDHFQITTRKMLIATNGFAGSLGIEQVKPARAQVLVTHPIPNLKIKGTFHLDKGYYYFRNINDRILLGGGRNLDFKTEETTEMEQTALVQSALEKLLKEVILPNTAYTIDHRWSGIMGIGAQKKPIVKKALRSRLLRCKTWRDGRCYRQSNRCRARRFSKGVEEMTKEKTKRALLQLCKKQLETRRAAVQHILDSVAVSLREETKSSAGDKHETGRAMLQLERENAGKQLAEIEKLEAIFNRIRPEVAGDPVHLGSVVITENANYFISIPVGAIRLDAITYYAIGVSAPIGGLLMGKKVGDVVRFRQSEIKIDAVY